MAKQIILVLIILAFAFTIAIALYLILRGKDRIEEITNVIQNDHYYNELKKASTSSAVDDDHSKSLDFSKMPEEQKYFFRSFDNELNRFNCGIMDVYVTVGVNYKRLNILVNDNKSYDKYLITVISSSKDINEHDAFDDFTELPFDVKDGKYKYYTRKVLPSIFLARVKWR